MTRATGCPASESLEAYLAGDSVDGVRGHLEQCTACQTALERLQKEQARFLAEFPPERFMARVERHRRTLRPPVWQGVGAAVLAIAAALAVIFVLPRTGASRPEVALKGPTFVVLRKSASMTEPEPAGRERPLRPGDAVRFAYQAPRDGFVAVLNRDGTGAVAAFVPFHGTEAIAWKAGDQGALPGAVALDDTRGAEWMILVFSDHPFSLAPLLAQVQQTPSDRVPAVACPGCLVESLQLPKEP